MTTEPPPLQPTCPGCGNSNLVFDPVEQALYCDYCNTHGATIVVQQAGVDVALDLAHGLEELEKSLAQDAVHSIQCPSCGSRLTFGTNARAAACPFCGNKLPAERIQPFSALRPGWILPFGISHKLAQEKVSEWIKTRWFAPQSYRKLSTAKQDITGVYLPFWSFDAQVKCRYTGERGTKKPEARDKNTIDPATDYEWRICAGQIVSSLNDIQVPASERLSPELQSQFDWKLDRLVAFDPRFLAGYRSEIAQIQLSRAHAQARSVMGKKLQGEICSEIGGDSQRVHEKDPQWTSEKFRLFLAPVWVLRCQHKGENKLILVDGQSGDIVGERPYSTPKIIAFIAALLFILYWLFTH